MSEVQVAVNGCTFHGFVVNRRGTIFVGAWHSGATHSVYRSRDGGATWVQVYSAGTLSVDAWANAIIIDKDDNVNFIHEANATTWTHARSTDEGASWSTGNRVFAQNDYISIAASPYNGGFIYGCLCSGTGANRTYFDFNQGFVWTDGGAGFNSYAVNWGSVWPATNPSVDVDTLNLRVLICGGPTFATTPLQWTSNVPRPGVAGAWASLAVGATQLDASGNMAYDRESDIFWYGVSQPATFQIFVFRGNPTAGFAQIATLAPANHSFAPHTPMYYDNGVLYMGISNDVSTLPYRFYVSYDMGRNWTLESQGAINRQWNAVSGMTVSYGKAGLHNEIFTAVSNYPAGADNAGFYYEGISRRNNFPGATWAWNGWRGLGKVGAMT